MMGGNQGMMGGNQGMMGGNQGMMGGNQGMMGGFPPPTGSGQQNARASMSMQANVPASAPTRAGPSPNDLLSGLVGDLSLKPQGQTGPVNAAPGQSMNDMKGGSGSFGGV